MVTDRLAHHLVLFVKLDRYSGSRWPPSVVDIKIPKLAFSESLTVVPERLQHPHLIDSVVRTDLTNLASLLVLVAPYKCGPAARQAA